MGGDGVLCVDDDLVLGVIERVELLVEGPAVDGVDGALEIG